MKIFQFSQCVYYRNNISHKRFVGIIFYCKSLQMTSSLSRYNLDKLILIHKLAQKNRIVSIVKEYFRS